MKPPEQTIVEYFAKLQQEVNGWEKHPLTDISTDREFIRVNAGLMLMTYRTAMQLMTLHAENERSGAALEHEDIGFHNGFNAAIEVLRSAAKVLDEKHNRNKTDAGIFR